MKLGNPGYVVPIIKSLCYIHVFNTYLIESVGTHGPSMLPTIDLTTNFFLIEKISTRFGKLDRGDIVVLRDPENPRARLAKRVVGLEGDMIRRIPHPMNNDKPDTVVDAFPLHIPKGSVWIEGDNKKCSRDSRKFGPVPYDLIRGKIFWRIYPFKKFGPFWNK